ncbi:alkylglycerol monooxygenase-like isoform X2 [Penaeus monodon]|uniref:alkylglycerol monooxygenase-like isoform X2 n=1 Tax=Penaeus monodon TaxID=6687 RepID=UPI0018A6D7BD|nr:alkylglycerol monooxygenase-like isoform X2 [Penaeus monodon]
MPRYKTGCVDIRPLLIRQTHLQALPPPALSTDFTLEIESGGPAMNSSAPGTSSWSYSLRANFYALTPAETYYEVVWQVPNMVSKALPVMILMSLMEAVILKLTNRKDNWRLHIAVLNYSSGGLSEALNNFVFRGAELSAYIWVYDNWRLSCLAWDSLYTYFLSLLGVEFCFYWWHRASHETALMWAAHSTHHSSEDFNMTVTARTSWTMRPFKWIFFLPLAFLGLPPSVFLMHQQLSYIYAGWTHNETVPKLSKVIPVLGHAIEFVFQTPSHHRVHHGAKGTARQELRPDVHHLRPPLRHLCRGARGRAARLRDAQPDREQQHHYDPRLALDRRFGGRRRA